MLFADRVLIISMLMLPTVFALFSGYAFSEEKNKVVGIAIVDEDNTKYSDVIIKKLLNKEAIAITLAEREDALYYLKNKKVEAVFILKQGLEENIKIKNIKELIEYKVSLFSFSEEYLKELIVSEIISLAAYETSLDMIKQTYNKTGLINEMPSGEEIRAYNEAQLIGGPLMKIIYRQVKPQTKEQNQKSIPVVIYTTNGIFTAFLVFFLMYNSTWLSEEKRNDTLKRIITTPFGLSSYFMANITAVIISGFFITGVFNIISFLFFGFTPVTSILAVLIYAALTTCAASFSIFISAITRNTAFIQVLTPLISIFTAIFGGCFFNGISIPNSLKTLIRFTPQGWALEGLNSISVSPFDLNGFLLPFFVLIIIPLILFPLSYRIIKVYLNND